MMQKMTLLPSDGKRVRFEDSDRLEDSDRAGSHVALI
jgi:hypothetical protein